MGTQSSLGDEWGLLQWRYWWPLSCWWAVPAPCPKGERPCPWNCKAWRWLTQPGSCLQHLQHLAQYQGPIHSVQTSRESLLLQAPSQRPSMWMLGPMARGVRRSRLGAERPLLLAHRRRPPAEARPSSDQKLQEATILALLSRESLQLQAQDQHP